ncbi:hypothetical protein LXD69_16285 [Flavobacterium sediminilitoris]|uniref:DUF2846 domain-containing protein n=1 Tax=Flavobacterium sediminilitoris TaxID=2024526 RepID=A0ABY4HPY9_9FLAO|nr:MULTISPECIES: hypothetical protein [Flavobacterium]UOX33579.1 hypothetical protein LXD69_16285 [Flavobacterium sediminilitoris]
MKMFPLKTKKQFLILAFLLLFCIPQDLFSQGPPPWAPAHGYRAKTKHIYFPDQNFYYDIEKGVYLYLNNGNWSVSVSLPSIFGRINLNTARKVELEIGGHTPYQYNDKHIIAYKKPKKEKKQKKVKERKH